MKSTIRYMKEQDRPQILEMMRVFYASEAVFTNGSEEIFEADITNCVNDSPYLEGYVFEGGDTIQGYAMLAKSFSTEFGKPCIWIEDIYVKEEYRKQGIMRELEKMSNDFFKGLGIKYVEVCYLPENEGAKEAWNSMGYQCFREQARKCVE